MAVKMLKRNINKTESFQSATQTDIIRLDATRSVWISSSLFLGCSFDISFGVFADDSFASSAKDLKDQNLLTLADLTKIGEVLSNYIGFVAYTRCKRRNNYKADEIIFSPITWGRYVATKRVLRKAMKKFPHFTWEFIEEIENGAKDGSVKITIN